MAWSCHSQAKLLTPRAAFWGRYISVCVILVLTSKLKSILKSISEISGAVRGEFFLDDFAFPEIPGIWGFSCVHAENKEGKSKTKHKTLLQLNHQSLTIIIIRAEISHDLHSSCGIKIPQEILRAHSSSDIHCTSQMSETHGKLAIFQLGFVEVLHLGLQSLGR